jgi:hypothetical protein
MACTQGAEFVCEAVQSALNKGGAHKRGGWTEAEEDAVRRACETTKGQGYEVAYEEYKRATSRSMDAFVKKANTLGYTWPR